MKITQLSVLAALVFATQGAFAQTPGGPGAPASGAATDASTVTNAGSATVATDMTTTDMTTTDSSTFDPAAPNASPSGEMANTGGEPQLMLLAGVLLAMGGLLIRRKAGTQSL